MTSRREFLKQATLFTTGSVISPRLLFAEKQNVRPHISILYTNDTHARLDPFPDNATQYGGLGGIAKRASLVKEIRAGQPNTLLLDAGDVFQGTPWFDVYGGKVDLELMSEMGYDAMAVGNHEFDRGPEGFAEAAQKAEFPILAANYYVRNTPLDGIVERLSVREFDDFKIGIFGIGIEFKGVIDPKLTGEVKARNPLIWANGMAKSLRDSHKCDYVICLSHLGYHYQNGRTDDLTVAKKIPGIDLIIGGHTHTFLDRPVPVLNPDGEITLVTQMGHSGIRLGRIDLFLDSDGKRSGTASRFYTIGKKL